MNRLLLSTALILGTLTGAKGALPHIQHTSSPLAGQVQTAAEIDHISPQQHALKTPASTVEKNVELILKELMEEVASLRSTISTLSEQLESKVTALANRQNALNTTLQGVVPARASSEAIDINAELRNALNQPEDSTYQTDVLNKIDQALSNSGFPTSLINTRRQNIETIIRIYLDSISDYSSSSLASVFTANTFGLAMMLAIVYEYLWKTEDTPKDRFAIAAPMGGGSTLATSTIAIAGVYSLLRDHALFRAYNYFNLSTHVAKLWTWLYSFFSLLFEHDNYYLHTLNQKWKEDLANPKVKAYLIKVLSAGWVLKNKSDTPKSIRTVLRDGLLESKNFEEIISRTFNLSTE